MFAEVLIKKENKRWVVNELSLVGFTPEQKEKHRTAQRMLEDVVNSWEFRQEVLAAKLTSTHLPRHQKPKTNLEVYQMVMNGAEVLSPEVDGEADIFVEAYRKRGKVVGYTMPNTAWTWVNLNFFDIYNYAEVAKNLFHEWLHKLGFDHQSASENTSVPYALGDIVAKLIKRLMKGEKLHDVNNADAEIEVVRGMPVPTAPVLVCYRSWRTWFRKKCYYV